MRVAAAVVTYGLVAAAMCLSECSCCVDDPAGDPEYDFDHGSLDYESLGGPLEWGSVEPFLAYSRFGTFQVMVWTDRPPSTEMVEVYDGSVRLDLPGVFSRNVRFGGCSYPGVVYDLGALPAGDYLLVHRRSSAPRGRESAWARVHGWETYDGEDALVMTLRLDGGPRDAGVLDGGM